MVQFAHFKTDTVNSRLVFSKFNSRLVFSKSCIVRMKERNSFIPFLFAKSSAHISKPRIIRRNQLKKRFKLNGGQLFWFVNVSLRSGSFHTALYFVHGNMLHRSASIGGLINLSRFLQIPPIRRKSFG